MTDNVTPIRPEFDREAFTAEVQALAAKLNALCVDTKAPVVLVACLTLVEHGALLSTPEDRKGIAISMMEIARAIVMEPAQ